MKLQKRIALFVALSFIFSAMTTSRAEAVDETYPQAIANALLNIQNVSGTNAFVPDYPARGNAAIITIQGTPALENPDFGLTYNHSFGGGTNYLVVRTVTNVGYYESAGGALNYGVGAYTTFGGASTAATWVTTGNDVTHFINTNVGSAASLVTTVEKGLGMGGAGTHTAIVEYGVLPNNNNLIRPTSLLDIKSYSTANTDYTYHATFTPVNPGDISATVFDNVQTYLKNWQTSALLGGTFPWTELGYTYYWGHSSVDLNTVQGPSEFIILGGTAVKIIGIYSPQSYYYTKNKGGVFSTDGDAQFGNGFGSFNVTGNCDTIWAGNAFQSETSTDAVSPNQIVIAGAATVSGGQGILVWSPNYTVTNNGTISGATDNKLKDASAGKTGMAGTSNVALLFLGDTTYGAIVGGKNILINSGSISSDLASASTAVEVDAGNTEITNSGVISGYAYGVHFKSGTNSITNTGTISTTGGVGGVAAIQIDAGTTAVNNTGGIITGNVVLASNVTAALDVGNTDLSLTGKYVQNSNSTLKLTVNSAADFGKVTAASAGTSVAADSRVNITVGGYIPNNAVLSNVISGTGSGGINVPTTITSSSPIITFVGEKGTGDHLTLTANRTNAYNTLSTNNGNDNAVGAALEQAGVNGATGDMMTVLNTIDTMSSAEEISDALATMTPDVSSGAAEGGRALTHQGFTTISNRFGGARDGFVSAGVSAGEMLNGVGVWMQALGSHLKQDMRKGIEGFAANTFGTTIGADKVIDSHFRAGFAGSYGWAGVKAKTAGSPSDNINSYQATLYGSYDSLDLEKSRQGGKKSYEAVRSQVENSYYVDGMMAFTQDNYDSRREIWVTPTSGRVAKADHYAQQYSTNFEAGYKFVFERTKALEVTPFASLGYNYLYMNQYKEHGADALNLNVNGEGFHQLEQALGTKVAYPITCKKMGTFIPSGKAAWLYDYIGDRFETTASFAGGGSSFNTKGAKVAKNGMLFGAELAFLNKGNVTVTGNWDIELKDQFMSNTYYGTVRYDF